MYARSSGQVEFNLNLTLVLVIYYLHQFENVTELNWSFELTPSSLSVTLMMVLGTMVDSSSSI